MTNVPDNVLDALIRVYAGAQSFHDYVTEDGEQLLTNEDDELIDAWIEGNQQTVEVEPSLTSAGIPVDADGPKIEPCDILAELRTAGWEPDERSTVCTFWDLPGVANRLTECQAVKVLEGEMCPAAYYHGPGHQSRTYCELTGPHDVHEAHYSHGQYARWRTGAYTGLLRAGGHDFAPRSYPETMGMSGYFDELTEVD